MKYVSLIAFMRMYGEFIRNTHRLVSPSHSAIAGKYDGDTDYTPFRIVSETDESTGQVLNTLTCIGSSPEVIYDMNIEPFKLPPILEMEWIKTQINLEDSVTDVLTQLSYKFMTYCLAWCYQRNHINMSESSWMKYLEDRYVIIKVDDLQDTPEIVDDVNLSAVSLPRIEDWQTYLFYGTDFVRVFELCNKQSGMGKEIYLHLPILLSMFMVEYYYKFSCYMKSTRIEMEKLLKEKTQFGRTTNRNLILPNENTVYTYAATSRMTVRDFELISNIFTIIYDKMHEFNSNMGLISFKDYKSVQGPDIVTADIRLSDITVDWNEEIQRTKVKEGDESEDKDESDDDDDWLDDDDDDWFDDDDDDDNGF